MFKRSAISLSILVSGWVLPAYAVTQTFSHSEQIEVQGFQPLEDLTTLAYLRASRLVQEQAGQFLYALPQIKQHFSLDEALALSVALYKVEVFPLQAGKEVKAKIFLDTDTLPRDFAGYLEKNPMLLESIEKHGQRSRQMERNLESYLERLLQASTQAEANLIIQMQGTGIKSQYQSNRFFLEGGQLFGVSRWEEAIDKFSEAIKLDPDYSGNYFMRSIGYLQERKLDLALADLNQAIQIDPNWEPHYFMRGLIYAIQGALPQKAIADFSQAIKLNPQNSQNYYYRGIIQKKLGHCSSAKQDFAKACKLGHKKACKLDCSPSVSEDLFQ